jgi:hypothetical protein
MNEQQQSMSPMISGKKQLWIYNLIEKERDGNKKTIWQRVGAAYVNRDGSLNLILDAIPLTGKCQVREDRDPPEWKTRGALVTKVESAEA